MWDVGIAVVEMNAAEGVVMAQFKMVVENELRMAPCGQTVRQLSEAPADVSGLRICTRQKVWELSIETMRSSSPASSREG